MNLLKSALSGVASAVGTHYADQAMNPAPYDKKVYYGVAAGGAIGAFLLRNKSPIGAGLLLGLGVGSAYQGYTRTGTTGIGPQMMSSGPRVNPYTQFATPTDLSGYYSSKSIQVAPPPKAAPSPLPGIGGYSIEELQQLAKQGVNVGQKIGDFFGGGAPAQSAPYDGTVDGMTDEQFYDSY